MKDLVVLVLAGGTGSRFWPFSTDKLLFPFAGRSLIDRTITQVIPSSAKKIVIVTNEQNHETFARLSFPIPHILVKQQSPEGMGHAIRITASEIAGHSLLILIGDDLFDVTLPEQIVNAAHESHAFGVIPGWKTSSYFPGGYIELNGKKIVSIQEKPGAGNEPSSYITFSGHYIDDADILLSTLSSISSDHDDHYEKALDILMKERDFYMHEYTGAFLSLKYPWHVLPIMDELLKTIHSYEGEGLVIKEHVVIEGPVYFGKNVKVMEFTKIVGPVYIGDNTIIGNNNVIRYSMIGNNCVTGFSTDITRSYIGNDCWFHTNYIGDSVLEENVSMGSGAVLANLKLDEGMIQSSIKGEKINTQRNKVGSLIGKNVRIGVNASIMPGVKIGKNSFVGAGLTITEDIQEESFVKGTTMIRIEKNVKRIEQNRDQFKDQIT